jgi:hypothetical protein
MTTSDLIYRLARAEQEEYRQQARRRRLGLEAISARATWPRLRLHVTIRPRGAASARA